MTRRLASVLVTLVVAAGCANDNLGRSIPACPINPDVISAISSTMVLQMQAVDTAEFVPCLNDLNAGWTYNDLLPEQGRSWFTLDSDRLGSDFLEVTLTPACDVGNAPERVTQAATGVTEYRSVEVVSSEVVVVVVPVTPRVADYARILETELEAQEFNGRTASGVFDAGDSPLADKVAAAAQRGRPIVIVDERDELAGTATLQMPDESEPTRELDRDDLFERLDDDLPEPSYRGEWFQVFTGGCVTYEFDATGPGVDRLPADVQDALGLYPAGEVRRALRAIGVLG